MGNRLVVEAFSDINEASANVRYCIDPNQGMDAMQTSSELKNFFCNTSVFDDFIRYTEKWQEFITKDYQTNFKNLKVKYITCTVGKKFVKIILDNSCTSFVDTYGNIYHSASWNAPAKGVRGYVQDWQNPTFTSYYMANTNVKGFLPPRDDTGLATPIQPKYPSPKDYVVIMADFGNGGREPYAVKSTGVIWYKSVQKAVDDARNSTKLKGAKWSVEDAVLNISRIAGKTYSSIRCMNGIVYEKESPNVVPTIAFIQPIFKKTQKSNPTPVVQTPKPVQQTKQSMDRISNRKTVLLDKMQDTLYKRGRTDENTILGVELIYEDVNLNTLKDALNVHIKEFWRVKTDNNVTGEELREVRDKSRTEIEKLLKSLKGTYIFTGKDKWDDYMSYTYIGGKFYDYDDSYPNDTSGDYKFTPRDLFHRFTVLTSISLTRKQKKFNGVYDTLYKKGKADENNMNRVCIDAITESMINEATSSFSDKLKEFIANVSEEEQNNIKALLNTVYLGMKKLGWTYEEEGKATKGKYKGFVTGISGSSTLDQLTWNVRVTVPRGNKKIVYISDIAQNDIRELLIQKSKGISGAKYTMDGTNNDQWEMVYINDRCAVSVGFPRNSGAYHTNFSDKTTNVRITFKVVTPHEEKAKPVANNDANHKVIMSKVKGLIKTADLANVEKSIESLYGYMTKLGGYVDGKRVMKTTATVNVSPTRGYSTDYRDFEGIYWKTELTASSHYSFGHDGVLNSLGEKLIYDANIDGNSYDVFKVGECLVGYYHTYGSRSVEYVYVCVLAPITDGQASNPFADSGNPFAGDKGLSVGNEFCYASYDRGKKSIHGGDLTDHYNEPRFYTTKKSGLEKAWKDVLNGFNEKTTMSELMGMIDKHTSTHLYYAMD